jgi:hypothetical protein
MKLERLYRSTTNPFFPVFPVSLFARPSRPVCLQGLGLLDGRHLVRIGSVIVLYGANVSSARSADASLCGSLYYGGLPRPGLDTGRACLYLAWRAKTRKTVLAYVRHKCSRRP